MSGALAADFGTAFAARFVFLRAGLAVAAGLGADFGADLGADLGADFVAMLTAPVVGWGWDDGRIAIQAAAAVLLAP
jgi:hypothetical protein